MDDDSHNDLCLFSRQHQFAIRATLLSTEILKARAVYLDAAMQFMRMTAEVRLAPVMRSAFP